MLKSEAEKKLHALSQEHLLAYWDQLSDSQRSHLLRQIEELDSAQLKRQQALIQTPASKMQEFEPCHSMFLPTPEDTQTGKALIAEGKAACLLVAGGQGTRLGFEGPKGLYPISVIQHKSLFQIFAEKVKAAGQQAGRLLPLAVMTSPLNHRETLAFFEQNAFFGLEKSQIAFFSQGMLPFLDPQGNLFLEEPDTIAVAPDGNGSAWDSLMKTGIWEEWKRRGIQWIYYILIDNPLADPFDAPLLGFQARLDCDVTVKAIERLKPEEKVGLLVQDGDCLRVVEYSEMPENERTATLPDGSLKHRCANISLFCFSVDFLERAQPAFAALPLHPAFKPAKSWKQNLKAWKFEKFIFDLLPLGKAEVLLFPREECFAPLKNGGGDDSPATVKEALQKLDRMTYAKVSGLSVPDRPFELSQEFHYPTPELLKKWHYQPLPDKNFINP